MVVRKAKHITVIVLLIAIAILTSQNTVAQGTGYGCCCVNPVVSSNGYIGPTDSASCARVDGNYTEYTYAQLSPTAIFESNCSSDCIKDCPSTVCVSSNDVDYDCRCGSTISYTTNTNRFCCASKGYIGTESNCYNECESESVQELTITGTVIDIAASPMDNALENVYITVGNYPAVQTDADGNYSITVENGSITITASVEGCQDQTKGPYNLQSVLTVDFSLNCDVDSESCIGDSGICIPYSQTCTVDGVTVQTLGAYDCLTGNTCYPDNADCIEIYIPPETGCSEGCYVQFTSYCELNANSVGELTRYNLSIPSEGDTYCSLCSFDARCNVEVCATDGECDGNCPDGCTINEDPDCNDGCNYGGVSLWCNGTEHITPEMNKELYCANCWSDVCGYNVAAESYTCNNGTWEMNVGEHCDQAYSETEGCSIEYECQGCGCVPNACFDISSKPSGVQASNVKDEKKINIVWGLGENQCSPDSYKILRCKVDDTETTCSYGGEIAESIDGSLTNFADTSFDETTKYCYTVVANFSDNLYYSEVGCVTTGRDFCMNAPHADLFCGYVPVDGNKEVFECTDVNTFLVAETCAGYCYNTPSFIYLANNVTGVCRGAGVCDECNSLYGMFAGFAVLNDNIKSNYTVYDSEGRERSEIISCGILVNKSVCYDDKTLTSADELYQCSEVLSCYDYLTEHQCVVDPCGQFVKRPCKWRNYSVEGGELGLGICAPINRDEQECNRCIDDNPLFPYCDFDLCSKFGECYYTPERDGKEATCKNQLQTRCYDFWQEQDCRRSTSEFSYLGTFPNFGEFSLDPDYNIMLTRSDDYFNFSKCKWDSAETRCYRDANDDEDVYWTIIDYEKFDCPSQDLFCEKDFDAPSTTILIPERIVLEKTSSIRLSVSDYNNHYANCRVHTYFCFDDNIVGNEDCSDLSDYYLSATPCYDYRPFVPFEYSADNSPGMDTDPHTLFFYSYDPSKNLEILKTFDFFVDRKGPVPTFSYNVYSFQTIEEDVWKSNLNVSLEFDEPATCNIKLEDGDTKVFETPQWTNVRNESFNLRFFNLNDNYYWFNFTCVDDFGNSISVEEEVIVEGDKSITNPTPKNIVTKEISVTISVETNNPADCRYDEDEQEFDKMSYTNTFTTSDKLYHNSTLTLSSGIHRYYTACNITYTNETGGTYNETTEKNKGDIILFAVDDVPPITIVKNLNFNNYYDSVTFELACNDNVIYSNGFKGSFDCAYISVCYYNTSDDTCTDYVNYTSYRKTLSFPYDIEENFTFQFFSYDWGGNKEAVDNRTIMIDNIKPQLNFTFYDENYNEVSAFGTDDYIVNVTSDKPIDSISLFSFTKGGTYSITPINIVNDYTFTGSFSTSRSLFTANEGSYGPVTFNAQIIDDHGLIGTKQKSMIYDTTLPEIPSLNPIFDNNRKNSREFSDYFGVSYPFRYYSGETNLEDGTNYTDTYFTNDANLFITGTTGNLGTIRLYQIRGDTRTFISEYNQVLSSNLGFESKNDSVATSIESFQNTNSLTLNGELEYPWTVGNYVSLSSNSGRTVYGEFGKLYRIIEIQKYSDTTETRINVTPNLETDVSIGNTVYLFDKDRSRYWFGSTLDLTYNDASSNLQQFQAVIENLIGNKKRTDRYTLFFDDETPSIHYVNLESSEGVFANEHQTLRVEIVEDLEGAGINPDTLTLEIDGTTINDYLFAYEETDGSNQRVYVLNYTPDSWSNSVHNINLYVEDLAANMLSYSGSDYYSIVCRDTGCSWNFTVDNETPQRGILSVERAVNNEDIFGKVYADSANPVLLLNYTLDKNGDLEDLDIVNVSGPKVLSGPTSPELECDLKSGSKNIYNCSFNESLSSGVYEFSLVMAKDLTNDETGNNATHNYKLVVDTEAPVFTLRTDKSDLSEIDTLMIYANVTNIEFELRATIDVIDVSTNTFIDSISLEEVSHDGSTYELTIPDTFDWGSEGEKAINVTLIDFAGYRDWSIINVNYDDSDPEIYITKLVSERIIDDPGQEVTVGRRELDIFGTVSPDTVELCYSPRGGEEATECIQKCGGGNCINTTSYEFNVQTIIDGEDNSLTYSTVNFTSTDIVGHRLETNLDVLLDLAAPSAPNISITQ